MKIEILLLGVVGAYAQAPANFADTVQAAMAPSLAQQKASIRIQAAAAAKTASSVPAAPFFTEPPPIGLGLLAATMSRRNGFKRKQG